MDETSLVLEIGTDNVFADTGVPHPEEALERATLMSGVVDAIRTRRLTDQQAAELLGTSVSTVAELWRGRLSRFSHQRLAGFASALGVAPAA